VTLLNQARAREVLRFCRLWRAASDAAIEVGGGKITILNIRTLAERGSGWNGR